MINYLYIVIALILNATANILMKFGASKMGDIKGLGLFEIILKMISNPFLVTGVVFFVLNLLFYVMGLTKINLSIAYPIMTSGGFLIISIFSFIYFRESLSFLQILGIIMIVVGITLVAYNMK